MTDDVGSGGIVPPRAPTVPDDTEEAVGTGDARQWGNESPILIAAAAGMGRAVRPAGCEAGSERYGHIGGFAQVNREDDDEDDYDDDDDDDDEDLDDDLLDDDDEDDDLLDDDDDDDDEDDLDDEDA